jgi:hypothetical protein
MVINPIKQINPVNLSVDSGAFRIKRPTITTNGLAATVDPDVDGHFRELAQLLAKRVFGARSEKPDVLMTHVKSLVSPPLTPKFSPPRPASTAATHAAAGATTTPASGALAQWAPDSLAASLEGAKSSDLTLSDFIDITPNLSDLKYAYEQSLSGNWSLLDTNVRFALNNYPSLRDYLVVYAVLVMQVKDFNALKNFILSNQAGVRNVVNYGAVSAARDYVFNQKLVVGGYNQDDSAIVAEIKNANLSLTAASFKSTLKDLIDNYIFNSTQTEILGHAKIRVPDALRPQVIQLMKSSAVAIDKTNIDYFLPLFLSKLSPATVVDGQTPSDPTVSDQDFDVEFLQDTTAIAQVSRSAVLCAAQLYYDMVLGDELDVFSTVNYFTNNYLLRGGIEIQDTTLRNDLQLYVFSNKFLDLKTNRINDRTRPSERAMFYKQVFNAGADVGDNELAQILVPNPDYPKLWKVLILETAKYIQQAQAAFYPDQYVPRGNIQQAVEDLQYNLSTHCTGMVNVVSPLIYSELDFVIHRIFMHDEVMRQIVPAGGTWWRVVETLYLAMRNTRPRSTVLYNKAKLGFEILKNVATYDPATFETDDVFSEFVSNVQAFITTQSILQQDEDDAANTPADTSDQPTSPPAMPGMPSYVANALRGVPIGTASPVGMGAGNGAVNGSTNGVGSGVGSASGVNGRGGGEWDF